MYWVWCTIVAEGSILPFASNTQHFSSFTAHLSVHSHLPYC